MCIYCLSYDTHYSSSPKKYYNIVLNTLRIGTVYFNWVFKERNSSHWNNKCQNSLETVHFFSGVPKVYDLLNLICPSLTGLKASKVQNTSRVESTFQWNKWQNSYQDWVSHLELLNKRSHNHKKYISHKILDNCQRKRSYEFFGLLSFISKLYKFFSFYFHIFLYFPVISWK